MSKINSPSTEGRKRKRLRPIDARTFAQICKLPRDGYDTKGHWILLDSGTVCLTAQVTGNAPTGQLTIPRAEFDRMARWYLTGRATA